MDLKLHSYKMMLVQELTETDHNSCKAPCVDILVQVPAAAALPTTNETHFHIDGNINKQNFCDWAEDSPYELHEGLLCSPW